MLHPTKKLQGFTLVELAVTLSVLSIIAGTLFMEMITGSALQAQIDTTNRMLAIRDAVRAYYAARHSLPCPAIGDTAPQDEDYGRPTTSEGFCSSGEVLNTGTSSMGGVPVKTLALPDEYALDGWGHKIMYMLDDEYSRDTESPTPSITVLDSDGGATIDTVPVVLISFGVNGAGSFPATGADVADRMDTLSLNDDEEHNAHMTDPYDETVVWRNFEPDLSGASRFDQVVMYITLDDLD